MKNKWYIVGENLAAHTIVSFDHKGHIIKWRFEKQTPIGIIIKTVRKGQRVKWESDYFANIRNT